MSIQDKLENASIRLHRKLFSQAVTLMGTESHVARYKYNNTYNEDEVEYPLLFEDDLTLYIDFPTDIPLFRQRNYDTATSSNITNDGLFLYDVLPIFAFARFEDKVERGDFVVYVFYNEQGIAIPLVFQVAEELGKLRKYLYWKKILIAPYNGEYLQEIQTYLDTL